RGHRAERLPPDDLQWQPVQGGQHLFLGPGQVEPELRFAVDRPAQLDELAGDGDGLVSCITHVAPPPPERRPPGTRRPGRIVLKPTEASPGSPAGSAVWPGPPGATAAAPAAAGLIRCTRHRARRR